MEIKSKIFRCQRLIEIKNNDFVNLLPSESGKPTELFYQRLLIKNALSKISARIKN